MIEVQKPPIGVQPYYIAGMDRIIKLSEAIHRYAEWNNEGTSEPITSNIKMWAEEIVAQCCLMENMRINHSKQERGNPNAD